MSKYNICIGAYWLILSGLLIAIVTTLLYGLINDIGLTNDILIGQFMLIGLGCLVNGILISLMTCDCKTESVGG